MKLRLAVATVFLFCVACSTKAPVEGINAFNRYDYQKAIDVFRQKASLEEDKDSVIYHLGLLSSAITAGDLWDAERASSDAQRIMWSTGGAAQGNASLVSAEALKIFKGEPFEKSMASIYSGILFYNRGEIDNARAAFGKSLLAVRQKQKEHREDFALPYVLQAKAMLKLGDLDNAKISLKRAQQKESKHPFTLENLKKSNALFFIELGKAPQKIRTGPGDSLTEWRRPHYPELSARVWVDGKEIGKTTEVGDLTYQAKTKGRTGKDTIQATKGVMREVSTATTVIAANEAAKGNETAGWVALGAGLFMLANQSQADTRQWELLPDRIQLLAAHIDEGYHTFEIGFYSSNGVRLSEYDQVWYHIPVKDSEDRIWLFRSGAYKSSSRG